MNGLWKMSVIIRKIRSKGLAWAWARARREFRSPTFPVVRAFLDVILRVKLLLESPFRTDEDSDRLYAFYDLETCPITFNFVEFLIDAEYESRKAGKDGFVVVFVPHSGKHDPARVWAEYDAVFDATSREWRFQNILMPLTSLSVYCKGVYLLATRDEAVVLAKRHSVYPPLYDGVNLRQMDMAAFNRKLTHPGVFEGLKAHPQGLRYVENWCGARGVDRPLVTITIRENGFDPVRNSDIEAWIHFGHHLAATGYQPVVIPDTDVSLLEDRRFDGLLQFPECAWNLGLRMALYERAFLNMYVANGPSALATYNPRCSYVCMAGPPQGIVNTPEAYKLMNRGEGTDSAWVEIHQRTSVRRDTFENLVAEFEDHLRRVGKSAATIQP